MMQDTQGLNGHMQLLKRYNAQPRGNLHTQQFAHSTERHECMGEETAETAQDQQVPHPSEHEGLTREDVIIYAGDTVMIVDLATEKHLAQNFLTTIP